MNIDGKNIVLTGASEGIGKTLLTMLIKYNCKIIAVARNIADIPKCSNVIAYAADVRNSEEIDKLFDFAGNTFGNIDIFISNAGIAYFESIAKASYSHIEDIFKTNVFSSIYIIEKMEQQSKERPFTTVVNLSALSKFTLAGYSLYCSTKHALDGFLKAYEQEGHFGHICRVYPITVETDLYEKAGEGDVPRPYPITKASSVAESIINGIRRDYKFVYPSKFFFISYFVLQRFLLFVIPLYKKLFKLRFVNYVGTVNNK